MCERQKRNWGFVALCLACGLATGCSKASRSLNAWLQADAGDAGALTGSADDDATDDDADDDDVPATDASVEPEAPADDDVADDDVADDDVADDDVADDDVMADDDVADDDTVEPEPLIEAGTPQIDSGTGPGIDSGTSPEIDSGTDPEVDAGPVVCAPVFGSEVDCGDAVDDDCDGRVDCDDVDCRNELVCCVPSGATELVCDNTADEDCDGTIDCADTDCALDVSCQPACQPVSATEGNCDDRIDDDCDELVDCADADCATATSCLPACVPSGATEGACNDSIDGDCDGFTDCGDTDCNADAACIPACVPTTEECSDLVDNDCDGFVDCTDSVCAPTAGCGCTTSNPELCGDGVDNNCDGVIDCPIITATVPESPPIGREAWEGGAVSASGARIDLATPARPSYVVQCRSGKPATLATKSFVVCNPGNPSSLAVQPFPESEGSNPSLNGVMVTEVRFAYPNGQVSQPTSFRYYVHNSLAGAQTCPRKATDQEFFQAARGYLVSAPAAVFADSEAKLTAPFVNVSFDPNFDASFSVAAGEGDVEYLSLRRRFTLSAAKDLILMRRVYASRRATARPCLAAMIHKHDTDPGPDASKNWNRYHRTGCDAVVMNSAGAGVCLVTDGVGGITIANPQSIGWRYWTFDVWGFVDWEQADNFMWRKLLKTQTDGSFRMFSPKCYVGGSTCVGTDPHMLFLPDRGLFAW